MYQFLKFILEWNSSSYSAMVFVIQTALEQQQDQDGTAVPSWSCWLILIESSLQTCMTYTIAECTVNNSRWWTEELSETCRVSFQNKFEKLVHLVGFIMGRFVTTHGHMSRCTVTCHDARSHVTMHDHMNVTMHGHMNVKFLINLALTILCWLAVINLATSSVLRIYSSLDSVLAKTDTKVDIPNFTILPTSLQLIYLTSRCYQPHYSWFT
jgi:hypothetical protein